MRLAIRHESGGAASTYGMEVFKARECSSGIGTAFIAKVSSNLRLVLSLRGPSDFESALKPSCGLKGGQRSEWYDCGCMAIANDKGLS